MMNIWKDYVELKAAPSLHRPYLLAAWSGMGAVAILAFNYLRQALAARELGQIDARRFFSPNQVNIQDRLIQEPEFAENKFYYWQGGAAHDLLFFIGNQQPPQAYEMAHLILDTADHFGVERIYTAAAFPTFMHHQQPPGVWGAANEKALLRELERYGVQIMDRGTIGGLNGLLLGVARERARPGLCLLGETPLYTTQTINPRAAQAVLGVLGRMLAVQIDTAKLDLWAADMDPQMEQLYQLLPDHARQALEESGPETTPPPPPLDEGPELVADDAFFDQIERFLQQRWQDQEDDDSESQFS